MSLLAAVNLQHKYLQIPNPKEIVIWRTNAADNIVAMQYVTHAFKRPVKRTQKTSTPDSQKSLEVHLWRVPLDEWGEPLEFNHLTFIEDNLIKAWTVKSVDNVLEDQMFICRCVSHTIDELHKDAIQYYLSNLDILLPSDEPMITIHFESMTSYIYYGGHVAGMWKINRYDKSTLEKRSATITNNSLVVDLATAWASRESLVYN